MSVTLILGGARSGKSQRAECLIQQNAHEHALDVIYIATSPAMKNDHEWQDRVRQHQQTRPIDWQTVEETVDLSAVLEKLEANQCALVDCLTLWLFNIIDKNRSIEHEIDALCATLSKTNHHIVLVSNELGMGLVPEHPLGRQFRDAQGRLNQAIAKVAGCVEFVVAGIPMVIKGDQQ